MQKHVVDTKAGEDWQSNGVTEMDLIMYYNLIKIL
jgi:hypothetical protein